MITSDMRMQWCCRCLEWGWRFVVMRTSSFQVSADANRQPVAVACEPARLPWACMEPVASELQDLLQACQTEPMLAVRSGHDQFWACVCHVQLQDGVQ